MTIARKKLAEQAQTHLDEDAPKDTCMSLGMNKWPQELGLPGIGTNSVSEAKAKALAGHNGWVYSEDLDGVQVGDFVDWDPGSLASPQDRHVSVVVDIDRFGRLKTIGSGGPTGKVYWQPKNGGYNPRDYFRGYFRVPLGSGAGGQGKPKTTGSIKTQAAAAGPATYTVQRGDMLLTVAARNRTTVGRLVKLNGLRNPDHIEVGQVLKLR